MYRGALQSCRWEKSSLECNVQKTEKECSIQFDYTRFHSGERIRPALIPLHRPATDFLDHRISSPLDYFNRQRKLHF